MEELESLSVNEEEGEEDTDIKIKKENEEQFEMGDNFSNILPNSNFDMI